MPSVRLTIFVIEHPLDPDRYLTQWAVERLHSQITRPMTALALPPNYYVNHVAEAAKFESEEEGKTFIRYGNMRKVFVTFEKQAIVANQRKA